MSKQKNKAIQGRRNRRHQEPLYVATYDRAGREKLLNYLENSCHRPFILIPQEMTITKASPAQYKMWRVMQTKH